MRWPVGAGGDIPKPWTMDVVRMKQKMVLLLEKGIYSVSGNASLYDSDSADSSVHTGSSEDLAERGHFNVLELMFHYGRPSEKPIPRPKT